MREQLNFRQRDIELGLREGRTEGKTERAAQEMSVLQRLLHDGKINQEQLEDFLNYMKEEDAKKQQASANINEH